MADTIILEYRPAILCPCLPDGRNALSFDETNTRRKSYPKKRCEKRPDGTLMFPVEEPIQGPFRDLSCCMCKGPYRKPTHIMVCQVIPPEPPLRPEEMIILLDVAEITEWGPMSPLSKEDAPPPSS